MKKLLLLLLLGFGLSTEWGTSVSVRTPNDNTKELDYELSVKLEDTDGKFQYLLKKDWERELGEKYEDDIIKFQHQVLGHLYYGVDYVNKESKNIDYITGNIGATIGYFKAGVSFKKTDDYDVAVSSQKISHFVNRTKPVQYWMALEPDSTF